jgi:hypothetical protein
MHPTTSLLHYSIVDINKNKSSILHLKFVYKKVRLKYHITISTISLNDQEKERSMWEEKPFPIPQENISHV